MLYVPRNWAFASTLCRPSICGQWLWTICTNCWGFTSFCMSAGLGSRNFVSFNVGDWTMSAARCNRAASRHTSNCNKWLEKVYTIVYSAVERSGSRLGRRGRWHGGEKQIHFNGTTDNNWQCAENAAGKDGGEEEFSRLAKTPTKHDKPKSITGRYNISQGKTYVYVYVTRRCV